MIEIVEGYEVPLHQSLTQPLLIGGAPRSLAMLNGTIAAALGLGLQLWIAGLIMGVVGHTLAVLAAKVDPDFVAVITRHLRHRGHFSC